MAVIVTEWNVLRGLDLERVKSMMATPALVDLRNIYRPEQVRGLGFSYVDVGRGDRPAAEGQAGVGEAA